MREYALKKFEDLDRAYAMILDSNHISITDMLVGRILSKSRTFDIHHYTIPKVS
jgi:hypothetical protein